MGDRTTVELTIRNQDRELVLNKFGLQEFYDEVPGEGDLLEITMIEVNYAGWDKLDELSQHMDFIGSHESGDTYGRFVFCSVGTTELLEVETGHEGGFVMHFIKSPSGEFLCDTSKVQEYSRQYKQFMGTEPF